MSRTLYDALTTQTREDPWREEEMSPSSMLLDLARLGRLRRAAAELAEDEYLEGLWVSSEEVPAADELRLAAMDREPREFLVGGPWRIELRLVDGEVRATQRGGPSGGSIEHNWRGAALTIALQPDIPTVLPGLAALPERLVVIDAVGRKTVLTRGSAGGR